MGKGLAVLSLLILLAPARADDKLVRPLGDSEIDWGAGTISAKGGAAADLRMPTAEIARPGAERRARAAALAKLKASLLTLPLRPGGKLSAAELEAALAGPTPPASTTSPTAACSSP